MTSGTFTPSSAHAAMACPKCAGEMRAYERGGVIVDACRECRGIFLDRGELEHLVDLEADAGDRGDARSDRDDRRGSRPEARRNDDRRDDDRRDDDRRDDDRRYDDRRDGPSRYDDRRDQRAGPYAGDRRESPVEALGDVGELGGLGDLGDLLGRRDRSRSSPDPRSASSYPPKKRSSFFKDLLKESLGGE